MMVSDFLSKVQKRQFLHMGSKNMAKMLLNAIDRQCLYICTCEKLQSPNVMEVAELFTGCVEFVGW